MSILRLAGVTREVGTFTILDGIDAAIALGDRVGLVGPNGGGKTTLLRIAAGRDEPDRGEVHRKRGLSLGLLAQEAHFDAAFMAAPEACARPSARAPRISTCLAAELAALEHAGRAAESALRRAQHRFDALGGYTLDLRVDAALSGLGFSRGEWAKPPSAMSGGEQTRAFAGPSRDRRPRLAPARRADEPSRHRRARVARGAPSAPVGLAPRGIARPGLPRRNRDARLGAARSTADRVPRRLLRLPPAAPGTRRAGRQGKRDPRRSRSSARRSWCSATAATASSRRCTSTRRGSRSCRRSNAPRHGPDASSRCRARRSRAIPPSRSGEIVVRVEEGVVGYLPGRGAHDVDGLPASEPTVVARAPFLAAQRGERIGIVGPNGAGKTTLLRTIAGDLPPLDGATRWATTPQLGYLAQLRGSAIPGATVLDALVEAIPVTPGEARGYLARFLFRGDDVFKEVRQLSGGERSRLELALLGIQASNLLLLDEPTNHLDIAAREAIEEFLVESSATLLDRVPRPAAARDRV